MAIALVQTVAAAATAGATSYTATITPTAGNVLIVGCISNVNTFAAPGITGITDTKGNTYLAAAAASREAAGFTAATDILYAPVTTGGADTLTLTLAGTGGGNYGGFCWVREYSGLATSAVFDKAASATASSASATSGATAATVQANELVIGLVGSGTGLASYTAGTGFGRLVSALGAGSGYDGAMEDKIVAAAGAQTATFTIPSSASYACAVATFKDAVAGSGGSAGPTGGFFPFFG